MLSIFSIGDFIVLLVVAGALIAYRQMDKNNRSIQVVKRYIEHSAQRFETYVEEHITELREMDDYLKNKERQARDLIVEMNAILQDIEGHADDVFLLKEAMEKYDQVLIDLSNATQQVDINIERIVGMRDEIVNETKRTFHEISHTVMALEARVEGIKGEIAAQPYMQDDVNTMYTQAKSDSKRAAQVAPSVTVARAKTTLAAAEKGNTQSRGVSAGANSFEIEVSASTTPTATQQGSVLRRAESHTTETRDLHVATAPVEGAAVEQTESFTPPGGRRVESSNDLTAASPADTAPRQQDRITPQQVQRSGEDTRSQIIKLRRQGFGVGEIARNLSIPAGEVELVLGLLDEQHMGFASSRSYAAMGK